MPLLTVPQIIILVIAVITIILSLITLVRVSSLSGRSRDRELLEQTGEQLDRTKAELMREMRESESRTDRALIDGLISIQESTEKRLSENQRMTVRTLTEGMKDLQYAAGQKFSAIQADLNEKLDRSLNERLDENFKQVGDRLEALYKSLGELKNLESGVLNLNKTLSNVKSRGVFGEIQLGNILANTLDKSMYETNAAVKPHSRDFVEYAVKIPDKETAGSFILLPIDSKFPADLYNKIADASESADPELLSSARKELKDRIRLEAQSIRDKYIAPPYTTDFAVLFLPTEGLYAEALRIDGLAEDCQQRCKVILAGPMTVTALLNSLSVGFRYLTVNRKTEEIIRALGAFRNQFEKFDRLIDQTTRSLDTASKKTKDLKDRSRIVQSKLKNIEALETEDADRFLGLEETGEYAETGYDDPE